MRLTLTAALATVAASPAFAASGPFFSLGNTDFVVLLAFLLFIAVLFYFKVSNPNWMKPANCVKKHKLCWPLTSANKRKCKNKPTVSLLPRKTKQQQRAFRRVLIWRNPLHAAWPLPQTRSVPPKLLRSRKSATKPQQSLLPPRVM